MNVIFSYVPIACRGQDCPVLGFEASATIGSDIEFTVPSGLSFTPSDVGELIVAPSGAAGDGALADCEGAVSCSYQLAHKSRDACRWRRRMPYDPHRTRGKSYAPNQIWPMRNGWQLGVRFAISPRGVGQASTCRTSGECASSDTPSTAIDKGGYDGSVLVEWMFVFGK